MEQKKSSTVIKIIKVTKEYKIFTSPKHRLGYSVTKNKKFAPKIFSAVKDVNLSIKKGEILGIIGKNGAGKSTLLKMITGVTFPTRGEINVSGRIASLLELGAGFNPELTGIENIYFQGALLGIEKVEMGKKIPEIIDFASIGDFIDQPVKNYSSGMFARLAFATAINIEPEILIVDEVLSVGDVAFQFKCIEKMKEFSQRGVTIIFVTHAMMSLYRFCNRAIWIDKGKVVLDGTVEEVVPVYEDSIKKSGTNNIAASMIVDTNEIIRVTKIETIQKDISVSEIKKGVPFLIEIGYELMMNLEEHPYFALSIVKEGVIYDMFGIYPAQNRYTLPKVEGKRKISVTFVNPALNSGKYEVYFSISEKNGISQLYFSKILDLQIVGKMDSLGLFDIEHKVVIM
ncbi:MAG: polysaccharide ABC transporter ATP-binding protein [Culicoidibacterales bacterium]